MIYAICNPIAGSGRGKIIGEIIEKILNEKKLAYIIAMTEKPGHATELAREACSIHAETILAIGGDGTSLEVARGMIGRDSALGIIPAGTGNDFVKTLGVPLQPIAALEYISSAGLRVLMGAQKALAATGGKVRVVNPNAMVKGVLDITGFSAIFC